MTGQQYESTFIGKEWTPLLQGISHLIGLTETGDYITLQTYLERFENHPRTSPYFSVCVQNDGQIEAEIAGNVQLSPKLTVEEYNLMELLGWEKPKVGKDETYGDYPNFRKIYPLDTEADSAAEDILTALVLVYQMKPSDMIGVGKANQAERLDSLKKLVRLETEPWNKGRKLFRLPMKEEQ